MASGDTEWNPPKGKGGTQPFTNPLLVRPELAKVRPPTYDLPGAGYTYGKPMERDAEGAAAVTMSWKQHVPNPDQIPGCDFRVLNRAAVIEGNFTAKTQARFRRGKKTLEEYRLKQGQDVSAKDASLPSDGNPDYMYGKASRPSTPIEFLMTNSYLRSFVEDQKEKHEGRSAQSGAKKKAPVRHTKTSKARNGAIKEQLDYVEADSSWKMSKFSNVPSKISQ